MVNLGGRTDALEGNAVQFVSIRKRNAGILNAGVEQLAGVVVGRCAAEKAR